MTERSSSVSFPHCSFTFPFTCFQLPSTLFQSMTGLRFVDRTNAFLEVQVPARGTGGRPERSFPGSQQGNKFVGAILIIILLVILLGGGGGYYAHGRYGRTGLGGVLGLIIIILIVLWLVGALSAGVHTPI